MHARTLLEGLLSAPASALYQQVLSGERQPPERSELADRAEVRELVELGFLQPSPASQRLVPASPQQAVEHLVLARQQEVTTRLRVLLAAREDGHALQRIYDEQRAMRGDVETVEVFTDAEAISSISHDVWFGAHEEVATFDTQHFKDVSVLTDERSIDIPPLDMAGRVTIRALYDRSLLEIPGTLDVLRRTVEAGVTVRIASSLPLKMIIVDRQVSLLPLDPVASRVVLIRSAVVAAAHMALFDQVWATAVPFAAGSAVEAGLTGAEKSVLTMVGLGIKDEAAARQLGISTRTLRRHLAALEDRFGVDSRVSLIVAATRQGLL